jgi:hypothetical protein
MRTSPLTFEIFLVVSLQIGLGTGFVPNSK